MRAKCRVLSVDPPIWEIPDFMSAELCAEHIAAGKQGKLRTEQYSDRVLLDRRKLGPLVPLALFAGLPRAYRAWEAGNDWVHTYEVVEALALAVLVGLVAVTPTLVEFALGAVAGAAGQDGKSQFVHTGTKFLTEGTEHCTEDFLGRVREVVPGAYPERCEPPTVTSYLDGEQQRTHIDCRGATGGGDEKLGPYGQRLANVLVYLNDVPEGSGGATTFDKLGLSVLPEAGKALVFFPAFADGTIDYRVSHAGDAIRGEGVEKWILNTWVCEEAGR